MRRADELGWFLRSRRARVDPEMVGLAPGDRRRVEGLRREELAHLAHISVDYLIRLEQGRVARPSPEIVEALARSLLLDESERRHLFRLAAASEPAAEHGDGTAVRAGIELLIRTFDPAPAVLLSRRLDLLSWNSPAEALLGPFAEHGNYARMIFRDPAQRALHADWEESARQTVALLRYAHVRHPDDAKLRALADELGEADERFGEWWNRRDVAEKRYGAKRYVHPTVGALTPTYEALPLPDEGDQILTIYTVAPGTEDAGRLARLTLEGELSAAGGAAPTGAAKGRTGCDRLRTRRTLRSDR